MRTALRCAVAVALALSAAGCSGGDPDLPGRAALDAESHVLARGLMELEGVRCADVSAGGTSVEDYGGVTVGLVSDTEEPSRVEALGVEAIRRVWASGLAPMDSVYLTVKRPDGSEIADDRDLLGEPGAVNIARELQLARFGPRPDPLPEPATDDPGPPACEVPGLTPPRG